MPRGSHFQVPWLFRSLTLRLVALGCASCTTEAPSSAGTAPGTLAFENAKIDFGEINQSAKGVRTLRLTNLGEQELHLGVDSVSAPCSGTLVPKILPKGESSSLQVLCKTDLLGPWKGQIVLVAQAPSSSKWTIPVSGKVVPLVGLEQNYVDFDVKFREIQAKEVGVLGEQAATAQLAIRETGSPFVQASLLKAIDGRKPRIRVVCHGDEVGMHAGSVLLTTGLENPSLLALSWGCKVPGTLLVEPTNPYFNLRVSGDKAVSIAVKSSQPDFILQSARIVQGPFIATVHPKDASGTYQVGVAVQLKAVPRETRAVLGTLLLLSNDRTEPRREVPLTGFGQVNQVPIAPPSR